MSSTVQSDWNRVLALLSARVGDEAMGRWFSAIVPVSVHKDEILLRAPNQIYQFWIESNYAGALQEALESVFQGKRRVRFEFPESEVPQGAGPDGSSNRKPAGHKPAKRKSVSLNERYRFSNFVVGSCNQHARAIAEAIASGKATYNPFFLHGAAGLGKTHLMHSVGNAIVERRPSARVVYATSEEFSNDFIQAILENTLAKFRAKYRQVDVLIIDDVQFLVGKERSQEEFFHTFNSLLDGGSKQVILAADCPANKIKQLDRRLLSRFEGGITAELAQPDLETRVAILRHLAERWRAPITPEVLEYVAHRIRNNVRRLEGALIRIVASVSMSDGHLSDAEIDVLLRDLFQAEAECSASMASIIRLVAEAHDLRTQELTGRRRTKQIAQARQICMYLARDILKAGYEEIGDAFGRDHGTAIHACKKIEELATKDGDFRRRLEALRDAILRQR